MKTTTLTQAQKQHDVNRLHDAFIAASIVPVHVEGDGGQSRFTFEDSVSDAAIQNVITSYVYVAPLPPADLRQLAQNFRNAVTAASTVPQLKSALNGELMLLIREIARRDVKDL